MPYVKVYEFKKQVSYDRGYTWEDVYPEEYIPSGATIGYYDNNDCMAQYRTIQSGYTCVGYDKHNLDVYQVSYDNGSTWEIVSTSAGTLIETCSEDCGCSMYTKYKLTLNNSTVVDANCDSTNAITSGEVATQYSGTVVSAQIGNCVSTIGNGAFCNCYYLSSVTISNSNNAISIGNRAFYDCVSLQSIIIPDNVVSIDEWAFCVCERATGITIGNGVTTIGDEAFLACRSATTLTIGNSVTTIGEGAFRNCEALTSITIPNSVITIGEDAFNACLNATSLTIGSGVTYIGEGAFMSTPGLQSITILAATPPTLAYEYEFLSSNCQIYVPSGSVNAYKTAANWSTYASRIQAIPEPFQGKYKLILTDYSISSGECNSSSTLVSYEIPKMTYSATTISAEIGDCVTSIGESVFHHFQNLSSVTMTDSITNFGDYVFASCGNLKSIIISNRIEMISKYAFLGCSTLPTISIPDRTRTIGYEAFRGCLGLTSITIGTGMTYIDTNAFYNCPNISSITIYAPNPPILASTAFNHSNIGAIYVPSGSVNAYKRATNWSTYASIIQAIPY